MKDLDRNQTYSVKGLTTEEARQLLDWLIENDRGWVFPLEDFKKYCDYLRTLVWNTVWNTVVLQDQWSFSPQTSPTVHIRTLMTSSNKEQSSGPLIKELSIIDTEETFNPQPHYDNTNGSLYLIAQQREWNAYQFDIVKRVDRALKKGKLIEDLQKTKDLIDLWISELNEDEDEDS